MKINKSQTIRDYLQAHPEAKPKDVAEALKELGITSQFVSTVKNGMRVKLGGTINQRPEAALSAGSDWLMAAARFINKCGGLEQAKAAVNQVEEFSRSLGSHADV